MPTIFKKNKVFIDKIDPTSTNHNYTNNKKNDKVQNRMSFIFGDQSLISENTVTAKLSNSISVGLLNKVAK